MFWRSHDPTTPERQGHDVGPQYRSVIFYHSERQRRLAERYKMKILPGHDAQLIEPTADGGYLVRPVERSYR